MARPHTCVSGCSHDHSPISASLDRRRLLLGASALATASGLSLPHGALAQAKPHRIDVHHHISPPKWVEALKKAKLDTPPVVDWTPQRSIEDMDKAGIATSIVSPTTPQLNFLGKEEAAAISRSSNEYAKQLMSDHPGRFGVFAMLPMPHVDESLKEIAYAFDTLKVDGVGLMTDYGDKWLGYPEFDAVWAELNRRKATVYTHPTEANCCVNLVKGIPPTVVEYGADTTRSIASLIFSGTAQKYPDINWIFSHGGGALTSFAERFLVQMVRTPPYRDKFTRESVHAELKKFHYDTAQISMEGTLAALAKLVPVSQIVYGTDYPYRTGLDHTKGVAATFNGADLDAVERGNALRILPRLRA